MSTDVITDVMFEWAGGKVSASDTKKMVDKLVTMRNNEHQQGTQSMRNGSQMKRFIRYQRKAAAHVSKALSKSNITKPKL